MRQANPVSSMWKEKAFQKFWKKKAMQITALLVVVRLY
jgi:hypothetical protein